MPETLEDRETEVQILTPPALPTTGWRAPHRLMLVAVAAVLVLWAALTLNWSWLPQYMPELLRGFWITILMLVSTCILGFILAVPIGLAQAAGPWYLAAPARAFCTIIRGTPLLLQLWLLYYGLGSLFPGMPGIRQSWLWPYLREAWPYGVATLTLSFAGYEGEVMRGAFKGVPRSELEAADAFGMSRLTKLWRIWLPRAVQRALPTLNGEAVLQLKSTPLVATITVFDLFAVISKVRQDSYLTYEPLLFLALVYLCLTGLLTTAFRYFEKRIPGRGA